MEYKLADYFSEEKLKDLDASANQPQDALFWPGQMLVAKCKGRKIKNGLQYEVIDLCEESVAVKRASR